MGAQRQNRVLWGAWRTDSWNPVFLAPVFTGLEYGAFRVFGVGTWQARVVPAASGLAAIAFLMAGLNAMSGRRTAPIAGALLATNYVSVMWDRAALMESTMTSFMVIGWASYALAARRPRWGLVGGTAAALAFFTKASAAFFVAAVVLEAVTVVAAPDAGADRRVRPRGLSARGSMGAWTLAGLMLAGTAIAVGFVLPHWSEYRFYTWQMSVERKPEYTVRALVNRASWLPLVHDFFTWMWPLLPPRRSPSSEPPPGGVTPGRRSACLCCGLSSASSRSSFTTRATRAAT
jgi:4-amino-4-deoxy-L-arabinose transferase-like glycosyltransferase